MKKSMIGSVLVSLLVSGLALASPTEDHDVCGAVASKAVLKEVVQEDEFIIMSVTPLKASKLYQVNFSSNEECGTDATVLTQISLDGTRCKVIRITYGPMDCG